MCDSPANSGTLCFGGIRGLCQLAAAGGGRRAPGLSFGSQMPLPHCPATVSGCLSRANNALSVGDCLTVNNVRIA